MSKWERWLIAVSLFGMAFCPRLRGQGHVPMSMGAISINMPTPMLSTLVRWWQQGRNGCAFGDARADTLFIDSLTEKGPCAGAIGEVMTVPPILEANQHLQMTYMQFVLSQRPDLLFVWCVHDTTTVRGLVVPRILGVRRARVPVLSS